MAILTSDGDVDALLMQLIRTLIANGIRPLSIKTERRNGDIVISHEIECDTKLGAEA